MHPDAESPLIGEKWRDGMASICRSFHETSHVDERAVRASVTAYAHDIGCTESNAVAAANYGLVSGHYTLACIRIGKHRAEQLRRRQPAAHDAA